MSARSVTRASAVQTRRSEDGVPPAAASKKGLVVLTLRPGLSKRHCALTERVSALKRQAVFCSGEAHHHNVQCALLRRGGHVEFCFCRVMYGVLAIRVVAVRISLARRDVE